MLDMLAYLIAIAVPIVVVYVIYALDLFGTGKGSTIEVCLLWGATAAVGMAYLINQTAVHAFGYFTTTTLTAPIAEELLKGLILFYFIQRPRFRYFVDGAVYGFAAGTGFAISENIFYILIDSDGEVLTLVVKRVLSSSLMHAFASAILGIMLGLTRRTTGIRRIGLPLGGIGLAISIHAIYNNIVVRLEGADLLLVGFGIGIGGSLIIASLISFGLAAEKRRFEETLGLGVGITGAERRAVQGLGGQEVEKILEELKAYFGERKAHLIRELLIKQANLGILRNNLITQTSDHLHKVWENEAADLQRQINRIRSDLGVYVMLLLRSFLPEDATLQWETLNRKVTQFDPLHVHSFDLFMTASEKAETLTPAQLEATSRSLQRIKIFADVPLAELENLSRAITPRSFKKGEVLFERGDEGDAMYLIKEGHVDIYTLDAAHHPMHLHTFSVGDVVGELALLDGQPRSAWARAKVPTKTWILQRSHFLMFVQSRPHVIWVILKYLADRLRTASERMLGDPHADQEEAFRRISRALKQFGSITDPELQERVTTQIISSRF